MARVEFADAREFFCAVRRAAADADRISRELARMEAAEGVRAQGYESVGRGSRADVNGRGATIARMDYERRVSKRREEDYALVDFACDVIYGSGQTGMGGIDALLGSAVADMVWWRFCACASWSEVAGHCELSVRRCQELVDAAMDTCDAYGVPAMREGLGRACE